MKIQVGSKVRLSLNCIKTKENYGINSQMINLFGSVQTVGEVSGKIVQIQGWDWHIDDLVLAGKKTIKKKIEIQTFDPEYLDV